MRDLNKVLLMGRVGTKPEGRTTPKGKRLAAFSLATERRPRVAESATGAAGGRGGAVAGDGVAADGSGGGASVNATDWHQVVAWGTLARICEDHLRVGQTVFVEGVVHNTSYTYEDEHGVKHVRKVSEVWADHLRFLGGGGRVRATGSEAASGGGVSAGGEAGAAA